MQKTWKNWKVAVGCLVVLGVAAAGFVVGSSWLRPAAAPSPEETPASQESPVFSQLEEVHVSGALESYPLEKLQARSHLVAVGTVTEVGEPFRIVAVNGMTSNFTDYTFKLQEVLRGEGAPEDEVTVRVEGGAAGPYRVISDVDAKLSVGEEYLLFLYQPHTGGGFNTEGEYYWVLGRIGGAFSRTEDSPEEAPAYRSQLSEDWVLELQDFRQEMEEANAALPLDLEWLEREQLAAYAENLQNGVIEGDPDDMEQQLEQYATVVTQEEMEQQERARLAQEEDHLLG